MYCDLEDLIGGIDEQIIIDLSNDTPSSAVDQEKIDEVIGKADREIDGFLRGRYDLPLETVPEEIRDIAVDIAIYYLFKRRPDRITEEIVNSYRLRIARLKDIKEGNFLLDMGEEEEVSDPGVSAIKTNKTYCDRIYTKERLRMF